MLRTVVAGTVSDTPIQWICYHIDDKQGRGISVVFTMSIDVAEAFAANDIEITNSLEFVNSAFIRQAQRDAPNSE